MKEILGKPREKNSEKLLFLSVISRKLLLFCLSLLLLGCNAKSPPRLEKLVIGAVSYEEDTDSVEKYQKLTNYLASKTKTFVEFEPAFNELKAVTEVERGVWSIVFAPPGLAALAISTEQYLPILALDGKNNVRSVIVVKQDSPVQNLAELSNQVIALLEPGSGTGYYLPLYDLYGLTLAEVRFAPTPKTILQWLWEGNIAAGALSELEFQKYRREFEENEFRVLHKTRLIPSGVVLLNSDLGSTRKEQIKTAMQEASPAIIGDAGYIPNAPVPDYTYFIEIVQKVKPLEDKIKQKPAVLISE